MTGKRKRYSTDFKANVALEEIRGEMTVAQLAAKQGVQQTMINGWKMQAVEGMAGGISGKVEVTHHSEGWRYATLDSDFRDATLA